MHLSAGAFTLIMCIISTPGPFDVMHSVLLITMVAVGRTA